MNEWNELDLYNLPADIFEPGAWEFCYINPERPKIWSSPFYLSGDSGYKVAGNIQHYSFIYRYRRPELKTKKHAEIMMKWWSFADIWLLVDCYNTTTKKYTIGGDIVNAEWFTGRESADIPPVA